MELLSLVQQLELIERLARGTALGRLQWESVTIRGSRPSHFKFYSNTPKWRYQILCEDGDDQAPFTVTFQKAEDDATTFSFSTRGVPETSDAAGRLYVSVKRKVLKLDDIASELLADLDFE